MQKKHIPHRAVTMETTPPHREKTSSRKTAAIFIVGLLIASLAGYGVNLLMNLPGEHVEHRGLTYIGLARQRDGDDSLSGKCGFPWGGGAGGFVSWRGAMTRAD